jgi:6-phospho-3-hexuloisomerase
MSLADQILDELRPGLAPDVLAQIPDLSQHLAAARRIACYGVGREGLMMKALAMRLYHLGLDVHVVGDMTTPPVGSGDVLFVSAGPGAFSTVAGLAGVARGAGAEVICLTAEPDGAVPRAADRVVHLPAQTMAADQGAAATSILPMGSLFEGLMFLFFELLVLDLRDRLGISPEAMRANHTNLE